MQQYGLTYFDYIILIMVTYSSISGLFRGFVGSFLNFVGWVATFCLSYVLYSVMMPITSGFVANPLAAKILNAIICYLISVSLVFLINHQLIRSSQDFRDGPIDKSFGLAFGMLRGCIISIIVLQVILVVSALLLEPEDYEANNKDEIYKPETIKISKTYNLLNHGSDLMFAMLPGNMDSKKIIAIVSNYVASTKVVEAKVEGKSTSDSNKPKILDDINLLKELDNKNLEDITDTIEKYYNKATTTK